jgi:hypothetical protein
MLSWFAIDSSRTDLSVLTRPEEVATFDCLLFWRCDSLDFDLEVPLPVDLLDLLDAVA